MTDKLTSFFDFILLKLAKIYVTQVSGLSTDDIHQMISVFNRDNNFDKTKINLYPYLITMGNGHKEELLGFFGSDFLYTSVGIFNRPFFIISNASETNNLKFSFDDKKINLNLKDDFVTKFNNSTYTDFNEKLLNSVCTGNEIKHGVPQILEYIDKSIDSINTKYPDSFVRGAHQELLNLNRTITSFIKLENAFKRQRGFTERKKLQEEFNSRIKYEKSSLEVS